MIKEKTIYIDDEHEGFEFMFKPVDDTLTIEETPDGFEARYLVVDFDPESPDNFEDNNIILVNYHRQCWIASQDITAEVTRNWYAGNADNSSLDGYHVFQVTSYIHSGVVLYLGNITPEFDHGGWDTSHCGLIAISKAEWPEEAKAKEIAAGHIKTWNEYLSGDVYGCVKETYDKEKQPQDNDSVWGYYGFDYAKEELRNI
jgi:hypothetical protein